MKHQPPSKAIFLDADSISEQPNAYNIRNQNERAQAEKSKSIR